MKLNLSCLLILYFFSSLAFGHVLNLSDSGESIKWPSGTAIIDVYANYDNSSMSKEDARVIVAASVAQWNEKSAMKINLHETTDAASALASNGRNEIYFSSNLSFFANGAVVGITQISSNVYTNDIIEADIILNESRGPIFSTDSMDSYYLGNVVTHELGHLLGLAHGETHKSTMFYALFKGQHTLHDDDIAGINHLYPNGERNGQISGQIVGGPSLIGIKGANVEAISTLTGRVAASAISDKSGNFNIKGLLTDDQYYLYVRPVELLENLPSYYIGAKKNFCTGGAFYRGGMFESCHKSEKGYPQGISLTTSNPSVRVGNISISCGINAPANYMNNREIDYSFVTGGAGEAFVGFFSNSQISTSLSDEVRIDFSSYAIPAGVEGYFDLKLLTQGLYSPLKINIEIIRESSGVIVYTSDVDNQLDIDGQKDFNIFARVPLSANPLENVFLITVTSENNVSTSSSTLYPDYSTFLDSTAFYFMIASLSKKVDGNYLNLSYKSHGTITDNSRCPSGSFTYQVMADQNSTESQKMPLKASALSCATINSGDGSGGSGMLLGLLSACFIFIFITRLTKMLKLAFLASNYTSHL